MAISYRQRGKKKTWDYRIFNKEKVVVASASGFQTKKEAILEASKIELELLNGNVIDSNISLYQLWQKWYNLQIVPINKSQGTLAHHKHRGKLILEYFKDKYYGKEFLKSDIDIVMNRIRANISYNHSYYNHKNEIKKSCGGVVDKWFEQDKTKNMGMGWPKNPNEFIDYLTDTIVLTQSNNPEKTMGMLVAGKGLVWFTDSDGIRWTLKE